MKWGCGSDTFLGLMNWATLGQRDLMRKEMVSAESKERLF